MMQVHPIMRPLTRRLLKVLNADDLRPVQFLDIQLVGQNPANAFHFTDAGENLEWNTNAYAAFNFKRGSLQEEMATASGQVPSLLITAGNIDRQLAALLARTELEGATATLYMADRRLLVNPRDAVVITMGEIRDCTLVKQTLTFQIVPILGQQERIYIPRRVFQLACNYVFGTAPHCNVNINLEPITIQTTIAAGTTDRIIIVPYSVMTTAGNPANPNDYWETGYVVMMDGEIGLCQRPIASVDSSDTTLRFYLRYPMPAAPAVGDPIAIRRNCRMTKPDCVIYHGLPGQDGTGADQFGGFVEVPPYRFKPTQKPTPWGALKAEPPAYSPAPGVPLGVLPTNQPDPASLPTTITVSSDDFNGMDCSESPFYSGTAFNGVLTLETGFVLYTASSLDPAHKKTFGVRTVSVTPPPITPGAVRTPDPGISDPTSMWLLQCVCAWSNALTLSGSPGWVLRFYSGSTESIDDSGLVPGTLVWEGELIGQDPRGEYVMTTASCSSGPATVAAS